MVKRSIRRTALLLCAASIALSACASHPDSIAARYVSPVAYQGYNCGQLADERRRLEGEVDRISGLQRENANGDAVMLTVGLVLFWPALIGMAATKDRKDELARLKGEFEAVDTQARMRQCAMPIPGVAPPGPIPAPAMAAVPQPPLPPRDAVLATQSTPARRKALGLEVLPVDSELASSTSLAEAKGVYIANVFADGAAATGGLRQHDVILAFAAAKVDSVGDMQRVLSDVRPGSRVPVTIWRDLRTVQAELAF